MALVVLLKGVNVGGHRTFRPRLVAKALAHLDVVNIGAAGTFVVRKPVSRARLRAEILRRLPFVAEVMICDGRDILRLAASNPFARQRASQNVLRFVSVMGGRPRRRARMPVILPTTGAWCVKVLDSRFPFALGVYRREMRAIGLLGQLEKVVGVSLTTRQWSTMLSIARILRPTG